MKLSKLLIVLLLSLSMASCKNASNVYDQLSLECGEATSGKKYLRIQGADGSPIEDYTFLSHSPEFSGYRTSQGCLALDEGFSGPLEFQREAGHQGLYLEQIPSRVLETVKLKPLGNLPFDIWSACGVFTTDYARDDIIIKPILDPPSDQPLQIVGSPLGQSTNPLEPSERGCFKTKANQGKILFQTTGHGAIAYPQDVPVGVVTSLKLTPVETSTLFSTCGIKNLERGQKVLQFQSTTGDPIEPVQLKLEYSLGHSSAPLPYDQSPLGCLVVEVQEPARITASMKDEWLGQQFPLSPDSPPLTKIPLRPYFTPFDIWKICGDGLDTISEDSRIFHLQHFPSAFPKLTGTHVLPNGDRRALKISEYGCISRHRDERGLVYIEDAEEQMHAVTHLDQEDPHEAIQVVGASSRKDFCSSGEIRYVEGHEEQLQTMCAGDLRPPFLALCEIVEGFGKNQPRFEEIRRTVSGVKHTLDAEEKSCAEVASILQDRDSLDLSSYQVSDLSPLHGLEQLKNLYLTDNRVVDLTTIRSLTGIEGLFLAHNQLSDISGIRHLKSLKIMDLTDNKLVDISDLSSLPNLTHLRIRYNSIQRHALQHLAKAGLNLISNEDFYQELEHPQSKVHWTTFHMDPFFIEEGKLSPQVYFEATGPEDFRVRYSYLGHGFGTECYWDRPEHTDDHTRYVVKGRVDSPFRNLCTVLVAVERSTHDFPPPQIILFKNKERRATKQSVPVWVEYPMTEQKVKRGELVRLRLRALDPKGLEISYRFPDNNRYFGECSWLRGKNDPENDDYVFLEGTVPEDAKAGVCSRYVLAENELTRFASILPFRIVIDGETP